jgi:hypothetical protein
MDDKEDFQKVIEDFFANASPEDLLELEAYLAKRGNIPGQQGPATTTVKSKQGVNKLDAKNMAKSFASTLQQRMGLTSEKINQTARDAVRTMILQYDPFVPEKQIDALLDKFVPDKENQWKKIPAESMRAMISQYTAYGRGEMTEENLKSFPEGWAKKYWSNFPPKIQVLIKGYIEDKISKSDFWNFVEALLTGK